MTVTLDRQVFSLSRAAEYFSIRELQTLTGQPRNEFGAVILKELVDNALDAAETAGRDPMVKLDIVTGPNGLTRLVVSDNGEGLPAETLRRLLDFERHTSDKVLYRTPTRGAQGNAFKTVLGIPTALGGTEPITVESCGYRHHVRAYLDPAGQVRTDHRRESVPTRQGTRITVTLPDSELLAGPRHWARAYSLFNPHASVKIRQFEAGGEHANSIRLKSADSYRRTMRLADGWRKHLPGDLPSPHWFTAEALAALIFAHVSHGHDWTLREFVRQFRGLSSTVKAKAVGEAVPVKRISDFDGHHELIEALLDAMKAHSAPPKPDVLGMIGEEHLRQRLEAWHGVRRHWYKSVKGEAGGLPFVVEVLVADTREHIGVYHGLNYSPTFADPINHALQGGEASGSSIVSYLQSAHALPSYFDDVSTAVAFHLTAPALEFLDKGKSKLAITSELADAIAAALWSTSKTLYKEHKARERDEARERRLREKRDRAYRRYEWTLKDAVFEVLPAALDKATGAGAYPVSARTLYYQARPLVQAYTSKELDYNYFSQNLLTEYRHEVGTLQGLYYDPRGILYEPHSGEEVPLGTREVDSYEFPKFVFDKILYVEKKGLYPIFEAAALGKRYDMAIIAAEGYATEAARVLFANASRDQRYQLFVLHDADPYGYNIARTLTAATRRMPEHEVEVIDLGLSLEEALTCGLEPEHFTRKASLPEGLDLNEVEREYFVGKSAGRKSWSCRRVELNAFTAPELIEYVEGKLAEQGATGKVIPPPGVLAEHARGAQRQAARTVIEAALEDLIDLDALAGSLSADLPIIGADQLKADLDERRERSWRQVSEGFARRQVDPEAAKGTLTELLRRMQP